MALGPVPLTNEGYAQIQGSQNTPTMVAGPGAGTNPTVFNLTGTNTAGLIAITVGTGPTANANIAVINFADGLTVNPLATSYIISPRNGGAAALSGGQQVYTIPSGGIAFRFSSGSTPLAAGGSYQWFYAVVR